MSRRVSLQHLPIQGRTTPLLSGCGVLATSSSLTSSLSQPRQLEQVRHATLIKRPVRPYTFTQLIQLSDGSTYTHRTTSPHGMYRSAKDTRNHPRWQPNDRSLKNVEIDEAGKLAAFRERFGHGWDAEIVEDRSQAETEISALMVGKKRAARAKHLADRKAAEELAALIASGGEAPKKEAEPVDAATEAKIEQESEDGYAAGSLIDLIGGYAKAAGMTESTGLSAKEQAKKDKKKGKKK